MDTLITSLESAKTIIIPWIKSKQYNHNFSDIIDPLTTIVNIALLQYKAIGTKLIICNNQILINQKNILQGFYRQYFGYNKLHVKLLLEPIVNACKYYLIANNDRTCMEPIFLAAISGLNNLKHTYKNDPEICDVINIYVNLIDASINNNEATIQFLESYLNLLSTRKTIIDDNVNEVISIKNQLYKQLNEIWSDSRRTILVNAFNELIKKKNNEIEYILKNIFYLLQDCHQDVELLLKHLST